MPISMPLSVSLTHFLDLARPDRLQCAIRSFWAAEKTSLKTRSLSFPLKSVSVVILIGLILLYQERNCIKLPSSRIIECFNTYAELFIPLSSYDWALLYFFAFVVCETMCPPLQIIITNGKKSMTTPDVFVVCCSHFKMYKSRFDEFRR